MKRLLMCIAAICALSFVTSCKSSKQMTPNLSNTQEAKIGLSDGITTTDPRKARHLSTVNLIQMMFEGLTRVDGSGNVLPGMAQNIHISPDMKSYTFHIRDCKWSNGEPVSASDFEYSWKSQLNSDMKAANSYMLFTIKGAQAAFEGKASLDDVGIKAVDDKTLVVMLENPTPYFLQLTATHPYFPVNQKWMEAHPDWHAGDESAPVSNGPFALDSWRDLEEIALKKNPEYWAQDTVHLTKVIFPIVNDFTAAKEFIQNELDWIGAPVGSIPQNAYTNLKTNDRINSAPAAGTQFLRVNIEKGPFTNAKMRRAFCLAIDSQAIIDSVMKGDQKPAISFVPPSLGLPAKEYFVPHDQQMARQLFEEALSEMHMSRDDLPVITLSFIDSERTQKMAQLLQQNWKETFNVNVALQGSENASFYDKIFSKDYKLALGSWFADYFDPMSFLSIFQYKENGTNNTQWSNSDYTRLLEESCLEMNPQKRLALLQEAEDILMQEMPIMPIFYFSFNFAKNDQLQAAELSPLGQMQLNQAYMIQAPATSTK